MSRITRCLLPPIALLGGEAALDTDAPYVVSITVEHNPDKTRYYAGETFDPTGMVVTAVYNDGHKENINGYKLSLTKELTLGNDTVYITYGVLKTSLTIEVRERMPWSGEGTEEDPYLIGTADDLVDLRYYVFSKRMKTTGVYFRMTPGHQHEEYSGLESDCR